MASVQRQPFAELGASRLQGLTSQKNCQNAITDGLSNGLGSSSKTPQSTSQTKRPFTPLYEDEDFDSENIDPEFFSSKRSKGSDGTPSKKSQPLFNLNTLPGEHNIKKSSLSANKPITPTSPLFDKSVSTPQTFTLPSGISSAPAGRSPKHKRIGLLSRKRNSLSPFKRIEPPSLNGRKPTTAGLPFSIDAALKGTLSKGKDPVAAPLPTTTLAPMPAAAPQDALTLGESMPKSWFFDIHEDTAEEEAANLMEHSTGILDISSDDEAGPSKKDDRGKENVPPADHVVNANPSEMNTQLPSKEARRSFDPDAMKDVGEERAALGSLPAEEFYGKGLHAKSVEIVKAEQDEENAPSNSSGELDVTMEAKLNDENTPAHALPSPLPGQTALDNDAQRDEDAPSFDIAIDKENA